MIQKQTLLTVVDNSGGKIVRCIHILKKGKKPRHGRIGDVIVCSVQQIRKKNKLTSKVKKGDVLYGVIVKTSTFLKRSSGLSFCFSKNAVVLLNKQFKPLATRVFGVIPAELRNKKFTKIISLSSGLL
jgi:large subunit ribosomal protein L14